MFSRRKGSGEGVVDGIPTKEKALSVHKLRPALSCWWRTTCGSLVQTPTLESTYPRTAATATLYSVRLERYPLPLVRALAPRHL